MPHWDGTISLGSVLTLAGMLLVFYRAHLANRDRLTRIESEVTKIPEMEKQLRAIDKMSTTLAAIVAPIAEWWNNHQERRER